MPSIIIINTRNNVVQGLEGYMYFWDQGFEKINILTRNRIWLLRKKWDLQKISFGHGMSKFVASLSGIWELRKWAGKYREKEGEETLSTLPLPFFHFSPYAST